jgi:formate-dependent nitrite reductase cytochrome c552 subunit
MSIRNLKIDSKAHSFKCFLCYNKYCERLIKKKGDKYEHYAKYAEIQRRVIDGRKSCLRLLG